jgi:hypothetical protein
MKALCMEYAHCSKKTKYDNAVMSHQVEACVRGLATQPWAHNFDFSLLLLANGVIFYKEENKYI